MKRFCQTFLLLLLAVAMVLSIVACGKKDDGPANTDNNGNNNSNNNGNNGNNGSNGNNGGNPGDNTGDNTKPQIDLVGITFADTAYNYNSSKRTLQITGTLPEGVTVRYEYWNEDNSEKLSDDGVTDAGVYTVRAIFSKEGCADKTMTAKLTINDIPVIDVSRVRFKDDAVDYDGNYHKISEKNLKGNPTPERVQLRFEYWNSDNTVMVDDGKLGVKEPGSYTVRAIYYDPNNVYAEAYVTATFIVSTSYNITYYGPTGTVFPEKNPDIYSITGIKEESILLEDASLEGYAFEGWYLYDAETNEIVGLLRVEEISYEDFQDGGDIALMAVFHKQATAPKPYQYDTGVTEEPAQLPAIPGYGMVQEDAVCILDVSKLTNPETIEEDLKQYNIKYNNAISSGSSGNYDSKGKIKAATPAAGGGYGLQWTEYHWQSNGQFAASMEIKSPNSIGYNLFNYDMLELWIYSANACDQAFTIFIMTGGENNRTLTYDVKLDFSGWRKFSLRLNGSVKDLYAPAGIKSTISEIRFIGYPNNDLRAPNANLATEGMVNVQNYIYFSNIYLTKYNSDFDTPSNVPDIELTRTLRDMAYLTRKANLTDAQVADLLSKMNLTEEGTAITDGATNVFSDLGELTNTAGYKAVYERLYNMATAWKCLESKYYASEELLDAVVAGMNYMAENSYDLVGNFPVLDTDMESCCLYVADVMNIFGDYLNAEHAKSWGALVLEYYPSSIGISTDAFLASYIYASIQLGMRNGREAITGIGQLVHVFSNHEIALTSTATDLTRFTALISAMSENMVSQSFVSAMFDWFYDCVDAMTFDGKVPAELSANCDLVPYIRAMLPILMSTDDDDTAMKFASYVKLYMAKDAGLTDRLAAATVYDIETFALTMIDALDVAPATPETDRIAVFETIGTAVYKTANGYLIITPNGVYANGIDASAITAASANGTFYGKTANGALALVRGTQMIAVYNGTVTVANVSDGVLSAGDDTVRILITAPGFDSEAELDNDIFFAAVGSPVIAIAKVVGSDSAELTVYAYEGSVTLVVNKVCEETDLPGWKVKPDTESEITTITVDPTEVDEATQKPAVSDNTVTRTLTFVEEE